MPKRKISVSPLTPLGVLRDEIKLLHKKVSVLTQAGPATIQTEDKDKSIDPAQGEVIWHHLWNRGYIWHHLRWRPLAPPTYHIKVFSDAAPVGVVGNGKFKLMVTKDMDGMDLYDAEAYVTTASAGVTVQISNNTQSVDMLSTALTIDSGELSTKTAATQRVIDLANDDVAWGDQIWIDVDAIGGTFGLGVCLVFNFNVPD